MPKLYCRVNPRTEIEKRDRAGQRFTRNWRELVDIDDATLAALQEDPYLEVSDSPTVLVEVAAATQTGAIEKASAPNNIPESDATAEGSTGETAAEGTDTGTASPVANEADAETGNDQPIETGPEPDAAETLTNGGEIQTGESAPAADAADAEAEGTAAKDGEQQADGETDARIEAIKAAIAKLDPNNAEYWLKDGRPSAAALETVGGLIVTAAERDAVWALLNKGTE